MASRFKYTFLYSLRYKANGVTVLVTPFLLCPFNSGIILLLAPFLSYGIKGEIYFF